MAASSSKQTLLPVKEPTYDKPYPPPLASYEDVVANSRLFLTTLEKLHATMGTNFMTPVIGGKVIDLHKLFVEVTSRGGIEKIIRERRWKEVTSIFDFPSTATNASFVLRKYYHSLLHHYEQIYFFRANAWVAVSSDSFQNPSITRIPTQGAVRPAIGIHATAVEQSRVNIAELPTAARPVSTAGSPVIGVIDGKFESGYLVTVTIVTQKLKGVLYHDPQDAAPQVLNQYTEFASKSDNAPASLGLQRRRRRKTSEIKKRDHARPKSKRSGYNFFFADECARLKPIHPEKGREISKMIGDSWKKLTESEKAVYQEKAREDKDRYKVEMKEYRERLRTSLVISDAMPSQFRLPELDEADTKVEETEGGDSQQTPEDDGSSGASDFEVDKTANKDLDMEESPVAGESMNINVNISAESKIELSKLEE